jgi:hypothetical protein
VCVDRGRFPDAQVAFILRRQALKGTAIFEVCRKAGLSQVTFGGGAFGSISRAFGAPH